jgi:hypothetical protein
MPSVNFAPSSLDQVINPWTANIFYGPVTYQTMNAGDAALEKTIVERVASYGRQLGRTMDALRVLAKAALPSAAGDDEKALQDFLKLVGEIDAEKKRYAANDAEALARLERSLAHLQENDAARYEKLRRRLQRLLQFG